MTKIPILLSGLCQARPIDFNYLAVSYVWFQDEEFRRLMMAPIITMEQHLEWFKSLPFRSNYKVWGVMCENNWIGSYGIKHIDTEKKIGEYWGYVGDPKYRRKGIGKWILNRVEQDALVIGLTHLCLNVWVNNLTAISIYEKSGYKKTAFDGNVIRMEKLLNE